MTCRFPVRGSWICALRDWYPLWLVVSLGGVRSHREDRVGGGRGPDRVVLPAGSRNIEHIGSAHDDAELEALKAATRRRLATGQLELDLGTAGPGPPGPLEIVSSRWATCWTPAPWL